MFHRSVPWLALVAALVLGSRAFAQTGSISGTVVRDSSSDGLTGVSVALLGAGRSVTTNYMGEFMIPGLDPGRYVIELRAVGYTPVRDTIELAPGQRIDREFSLFHAPVRLDSVAVTADVANRSYLSDFESRRKNGMGRFLDSTDLKQAGNNRSFASFLAGRFPGLSVTAKTDPAGANYLSSGRMACSGKAFSCGKPTNCLVALYIDGVPVYVPNQTAGSPPDLDELRAEHFAAVEWYPSGATAPAQYNSTNSACGVMLLWRKRQPNG
jgi:hypothetical protein